MLGVGAEQVWQDRDETHNFAQKYDAELIRDALRPGVRDEIRAKEVRFVTDDNDDDENDDDDDNDRCE
eukprot:1959459-Rhodomonas_salina.2